MDNDNSDNTTNDNNTTNDTANNTTTDNTTDNSTNTSNTSSEGSTNSTNATSTVDYSDYETEQYTDSNGLICLKDIGDRATYAEHKEWQSRQCDKLEADGYDITASHRNDEDVDGYTAYGSNGKPVVHIDA